MVKKLNINRIGIFAKSIENRKFWAIILAGIYSNGSISK